jgi:hypothetical protein
MLCEVTSAKHAILHEVMSTKHVWVSLQKIWMVQMDKLEEKMAAVLFVLTAFISSGLFNIFLCWGQRRDHTLLILYIHALSDKDGWGQGWRRKSNYAIPYAITPMCTCKVGQWGLNTLKSSV